MLEKKARLGVDSWGSVDDGVRHILDPVERTFDEEFPDFDPFPFGRKKWVDVLVRHILLAEPLVDEFAASFADASDEELLRLADSFAFTACARRSALTRPVQQGL
ncbi:MAG: hypothetical protein ACRDYU_10080 [Actinomycetes bacterium]